MIDERTRNEIADALEALAAAPQFDEKKWQLCWDLAEANKDDELLADLQEDLAHCSAHSPRHFLWLFPSSKPQSYPDFDRYRPQFRAVAEALRRGLSLDDFNRFYG